MGLAELDVGELNKPEGTRRGEREQPREKATIFGRKMATCGSGVGTAYPRLSRIVGGFPFDGCSFFSLSDKKVTVETDVVFPTGISKIPWIWRTRYSVHGGLGYLTLPKDLEKVEKSRGKTGESGIMDNSRQGKWGLGELPSGQKQRVESSEREEKALSG